MTAVTDQDAPADTGKRLRRKRHWWRWILASVIVLVVVVVVAVGLFIKLQSTPAPLRLPTGAAKAPVGPLDGTWDVATGSVAGFRVQESFVGFSNDVVGRTTAVTGAVTVANSQVTKATFRVDLTTIKVGGKSAAPVRHEPRHPKPPRRHVHPHPASRAQPRVHLRRRHQRDSYRPAHHARHLASGDLHHLRPPRRSTTPSRRIDPHRILRLGHHQTTGSTARSPRSPITVLLSSSLSCAGSDQTRSPDRPTARWPLAAEGDLDVCCLGCAALVEGGESWP